MDLETAVAGESALAREASSFLTKDYRNPVQTKWKVALFFSLSGKRLSLAFTTSCELRHIFIFHKTKGRRGTTVFWLQVTQSTCSRHPAKAFPGEHL